jgi:hypothetical protein
MTFDEFWELYPRKQAKKDAFKAWGQMALTEEAHTAIREALQWQVRSRGWLRGFIPLPATYLRGERWTDRPEPVPPSRKLQGLTAFITEDDHGPH